MKVYFICTGNTCRSPMAEAILRSKAEMGPIKVRSAGIYAQNGTPIAENAKKLINDAGMPYTPFSREISTEDIEWADLILTMTDAHKQTLVNVFPNTRGKVFTLNEFVEPASNKDVHDPFGGNLETYRHTFGELSRTIHALERKLVEGQV